jgi:hypothetical protein
MAGLDQIVDLTGEPAHRVQSAASYALKELAPGQSVALNNPFPQWRARWAQKSAREREEMMSRVEAALGRAPNDE